MELDADVIVIGAGAAGLAAARELSAAQLKVIVLEARERIGGRINTHFDQCPIELGAEFVHGKPPETLAIAKRAGLDLQSIPNRHWHAHDGVITKSGEFWSRVEDVTEDMSHYAGPDLDFATFLDRYNREDIRSIATLYVEGFHAAHADRISVLGLNKTNKAASEIDDEKQFRVESGYDRVVQALHDEAVTANAVFHLGAVVEAVNWKRDEIEVTTASRSYKARRLVVTLPLALLQTGQVRFEPSLDEQQGYAGKLAMGHVIKVMLRFREPFWEKLDELKDLTFIHAPAELVPTWWTQFPSKTPVLAGWAGGTRAEKLTVEGDDALLDHAMGALSHIFSISKGMLEAELVEFYMHNWQKDPFASGAYSYIPVGGLEASSQLAQPVDDTIFFAGEATNLEGHHGTVHGALATGIRAASEILSRG